MVDIGGRKAAECRIMQHHRQGEQMHEVQNFLDSINAYIWGSSDVKPWFTIVLLVGTGIYLTFRLKLMQITQFRHAISIVRGKERR